MNGARPPATTRIRVLPHPELCPDGVEFDDRRGRTVLNALLAHGIAVEHACGKVGACATCHLHLRFGGEVLAPADDAEEDQLDLAWGVDAQSRLGCRVRVAGDALVVELPRHSRNLARES